MTRKQLTRYYILYFILLTSALCVFVEDIQEPEQPYYMHLVIEDITGFSKYIAAGAP